MKTNGLPHLVKYEIHFDYSPALQRFSNLSKLAIACNICNNENISQSPHLVACSGLSMNYNTS